jgi:hypothetical protein
MLLHRMQALLARLYDAPVEHAVEDFLITDRSKVRRLVGEHAQTDSDEQVFVVQEEEGVRIGVFIDQAVLDRLARADPLHLLEDGNLHDYCTALEGVSHFHYLSWSLTRHRSVSLLELELQAEVDKYASALTLFTRQRQGCFPSALHSRLFHAVRFLPTLDADSRQRYEEANRHAARFCRSLEERFLRPRQLRPEQWLAEMRKFFRCSHQEKIRLVAV